MVVEQKKLAIIFLYSLFLGVFCGVVYGLFKFRRLYFPLNFRGIKDRKEKNVFEIIIVFFEDVLYSFVCAVSTCIFIYHMNAGRFRGIVLIGCAIGFIFYNNTIGNLVLKISGYIMQFICWILKKLFLYTVLPVLRLIMLLYDLTLGRVISGLYTMIQCSANYFAADKGFGIIRKKG